MGRHGSAHGSAPGSDGVSRLIAFDTNILVYAANPACAQHGVARNRLATAAGAAAPWALPWPCLYEFVRLTTHPNVFRPPLRLTQALAALSELMTSTSLVLLSETSRHAEILHSLLRETPVTGNLLHDAHIWALCLEHGVTELVSSDHDFLRFRGIRVSNPFRPA